jgi:hypothetical protein
VNRSIYRNLSARVPFILIGAVFCLFSCRGSTQNDSSHSEAFLEGVFGAAPKKVKKSPLTAWFTAPAVFAKTEDDVRQLIEKSSLLGIKKIYVSVWYRGCTAFASKILLSKGGPEKCPGFDWLTPMKTEAKKVSIELVPWLEWGLHIPLTGPLSVMGLLPVVESEIWQGVAAPRLNLFHSEVSLFFSELIIEAASSVGSKEVQICDNHALKKSQLDLLHKTESDFTNALTEMIREPKSLGLVVSLGALEHNAAFQNFGISWPQWRKDNIVSEVISELYHLRSYPSQIYRNVAKEELSQGASQIGIYTGALGGWNDKQFVEFFKINSELGLGTAIFEIGNFMKGRSIEDVNKLVLEIGKI